MNDTHGVEGTGWYGFDLDGTLAVYDKWRGIDHIGAPVKPMVDLMKKLHADGKVVKIVTARVAPRPNLEVKPNPYGGTVPEYAKAFVAGADTSLYNQSPWVASNFITDWCLKNLGFLPPITHEKDNLMLMLFDDRVKQVIPNKGLLVEDLYRDLGSKVKQMYADNGWLVAKLESKRNGFWAGFGLAIITFIVSGLCVGAYEKWFGPEKEPVRVRIEKAHDALCDLLRDWPADVK